MKRMRSSLLAGTLLLIAGQAGAETCTIRNSSPRDQWKFARAYDVKTGQSVLRQAINGGDSKSVTVSGDHVAVEWKFAGDKHYRPRVVSACKGGNVVGF